MDKGWYNNSSSYKKDTLLAQTLRLDGNANMYPVLEFKRKVIKFDSLVKNIITYFQKLQSCFFRHFEKIHFEDLQSYFRNYIQGSGITCNESYIHSRTMYIVQIERA